MILEVEDLYVGYGDNIIINGVTLNVDSLETVSVVGPNGAGKSTLLKAIMGTIRVKKGRVLFQGRDVTNAPPGVLLRLGVAYANVGRGIVPAMTVAENLKLGAYILKDETKLTGNLDRVYELFPILKQYEKRRAGLLSGGEQQMLALGASLVLDPKIVLLDEPSVGLAPRFQDLIFERIKELRSTGVSILLVEQNVFRALEISNRGYVLEMGRVRFQGRSPDLLASTKLGELYFGGYSKEA